MLSEERIVELGEECGLCTIVKDAGYQNDALWFDADLTDFARSVEREAYKQGQEEMRERAAEMLKSLHTNEAQGAAHHAGTWHAAYEYHMQNKKVVGDCLELIRALEIEEPK